MLSRDILKRLKATELSLKHKVTYGMAREYAVYFWASKSVSNRDVYQRQRGNLGQIYMELRWRWVTSLTLVLVLIQYQQPEVRLLIFLL